MSGPKSTPHARAPTAKPRENALIRDARAHLLAARARFQNSFPSFFMTPPDVNIARSIFSCHLYVFGE